MPRIRIETELTLDEAAAAVMMDCIQERRKHLFRETDEMCPVCQHDLEIRYCENANYMLRCSTCDFVAITTATCPEEAARKIGLNVKPVRHGRWYDTDRISTHKNPVYQCSVCMNEVEDHYIKHHKYCLHCGSKMDGGA